MQLPPPVKTFLHQYDLSGKTLIPFNTNGGYGIGNSFETVAHLAPQAKILKGYSVEGGKERDGVLFVIKEKKEKQVATDVEQWLKAIGVLSSGT